MHSKQTEQVSRLIQVFTGCTCCIDSFIIYTLFKSLFLLSCQNFSVNKLSDIFHLTRKENVDVVGDKPVMNDSGGMSMSEEAKQKVWAEHYERLLNIDFKWDLDRLSNQLSL